MEWTAARRDRACGACWAPPPATLWTQATNSRGRLIPVSLPR
ncbi:hypothetical protein I553_2473 [Mycobacterium xenopi 4042]|uniref:Uncharacterized protein n=1 Tax=Mycobacterium xenopi 4042 TaxID=1299334 RepID=X8C7I4_MYCXE|nr:hypothetical protein I552_6787 [Mycobacterium xenopi 3993]EUA52287.1 hypothetical protein I553_2473 [Mycobacterium xenopi 4042]